ncbi:hypothetical protein [Mucilaginibacter sp. SG564]|uniref:hypothetical protein n=1 Tax=unclassified Mucilaginibacter TaxID=2617802 RepID=UPI001556EEAA|nr:hypothetical protein [Mucilaginibacter sp. SG564]NOW97127.1 hypothetical protein [Mucilaginibacter sp. SG564]
MIKKVSFLLLIIAGFTACKGNKQKNGCGVQTCTLEYAYLGIVITDKQNTHPAITGFSAINVRTNKPLTPVKYPPNVDFVAGFTLLATDDNIKDFSTDGDDIKITATNAATHQTLSTIITIAGGCNCHVKKVSGPDKMVFD